MKHIATTTIAVMLLCASAFAHQRITIGPNGGRLFPLDSASAEVTVKDGKFHVGLFDKNLKPIPLDGQELTITAGPRESAEKLAVQTQENHFVAPMPKGDDYWAIFQFKKTANAKALTFRLHYQTKPCPECGGPEWLCACGS